MGRPSNIDSRRAQLADAFVGMLAQSSFEAVTISAIARAAQLAPGLVHHYFASKEDILRLAVERLGVQLEVRLARLDDPRAGVGALVDAWLALGPGEDPRAALAWVAIGDQARHDAIVRELYAATMERIVARTATLVQRAGVSARRAPKVALEVVIAIEGALRVGAAGALAPGAAAPLVRRMVDALLRE